jgi:hypothetical protein
MATTALGPKLPPPARPEPIRLRPGERPAPPLCAACGGRLFLGFPEGTALGDTIHESACELGCGRPGPTYLVERRLRLPAPAKPRGRPPLVEQIATRLRDASAPLALGQVARAVNRDVDDEAVARALNWLVGTGRVAVVTDAAGCERFAVVEGSENGSSVGDRRV